MLWSKVPGRNSTFCPTENLCGDIVGGILPEEKPDECRRTHLRLATLLTESPSSCARWHQDPAPRRGAETLLELVCRLDEGRLPMALGYVIMPVRIDRSHDLTDRKGRYHF